MYGEKFKYPEFKTTRVVGDLEVKLPRPPPKNEVVNYGLKEKEQSFDRIQEEITTIVKKISTNSLSKEEYSSFENREWNRRNDGLWFFNNGYLEYVTGVHYFYLCYWYFPVVRDGRKRSGLPFFIDADRDFFYFWKHCVEDTKCYGMIFITKRRQGKTFRGTCINYEVISRTPDALSGIQSKNNTDGHKVFDKLIKSWKKLPEMWKPIDSGETHPATSLKFREPSVKSKKKDYAKILESEITFGTAKEGHYDGDGLIFIYQDEFGKCDEADIYKRWEVVKECLSDMGTITGKALFTSTIEEVSKKNIRETKLLWYKSDTKNRTALGETDSGLYKYYKPAFYGYMGNATEETFVDSFGYSDMEGARRYFDKKRSSKTGTALASEKRKYSYTEAEAFIVENQESPFDTDRIHGQIDYNSTLSDSIVRRGNFIWRVKDQEVAFMDDPSGRFYMVWQPDEKDRNQTVTRQGKRYPANIASLCAGVDPFDHDLVSDDRKSKAGAFVRVKFNPMNPLDSKYFCLMYWARPPKSEIFFEDMVMMSFYYGLELLSEINKVGLTNHFKRRGYSGWLMSRPEHTHTKWSKAHQKEKGVPMSGTEARTALVDALVTEVYDNIGWIDNEQRYGMCYFDDLLHDLVIFDVKDWTPHDLSVAAGLALLAQEKHIVTKSPQKETQEFIKKYRYRGNTAREVK